MNDNIMIGECHTKKDTRKAFSGRIMAILKTVVVIALCISQYFAGASFTVLAKEKSSNISGQVYTFEDDNDYQVTEADASKATTSSNSLGKFSISGDFKESGEANGVKAYTVNKGDISFTYTFNKSILNAKETEWHLISDVGKKIDSHKLEDKIGYGAIVVLTSLDGATWSLEDENTNVFTDESDLSKPFYKTSSIQLQNGCYYKIVVAYEEEKKVGEKKIAFVTIDDNQYQKYAEVYEFYASSQTVAGSPSDTPRKALGEKEKTKRDKGFSETEDLDEDDPHYGWDIGSFFVNGYTSDVNDASGNPVFLKNVGDKVTLWFNLKQDINKLNGDSTLSIAEDKNAYDKYFEVSKTNFKHGALIIRYTDWENVKHEPIIYTDYLAANAKTGADTRVYLFEEGDYEVALDYSIKDNPRQVKGVSVVPTYTDYKILFKYSIRNSNCMVYPMDLATGSELSDNALTANGFKLDLAKSRYLKINVKRAVLKQGANNTWTEDVRYNRAAKDGDEYKDEGIYTFTVTNEYTNESTAKTIYVGDSDFKQNLIKAGYTVRK